MCSQIRADGEAALLFRFLVAQFLSTCLDGEVALAQGDDLLGRICVLDDEVTCVARQHHRLERALGTAADTDHIGDLNEMVIDPLAA